MKNSKLKRRILLEMYSLIAKSCPTEQPAFNIEQLHKAILQNHYNATEVTIDYHRRRIEMDIVMDDKSYDPKTVNLHLPTLHTNLWFRNLCDFLNSCIDCDNKSLAFYANLLRSHTNKNVPHLTA